MPGADTGFATSHTATVENGEIFITTRLTDRPNVYALTVVSDLVAHVRISGLSPGAYTVHWSADAFEGSGDKCHLRSWASSLTFEVMGEQDVAAGDANVDGRFDDADVEQVERAGKYLTGQPAIWAEGDWNGDGVFDQRDLVFALQDGDYAEGRYDSEPAIPDPGTYAYLSSYFIDTHLNSDSTSEDSESDRVGDAVFADLGTQLLAPF